MLVLILLLQVSAPSDPDMEVEVLEPLKSSIEYQLEEGNVEYGTVPEGWPTEPEACIGTVGTSTTINSGDMQGILMIAVQALEKRLARLEQVLTAQQSFAALTK